MKKLINMSLLAGTLLWTLPTADAAAGVVKYQGKDLVTQKDVDAKIKEMNLGSMSRDQIFVPILMQLAEDKLFAEQIKQAKLDSDADFQKAAKQNAEEFKRAYYIQTEAKKRITKQMRESVYDQMRASIKGKKEINPKIIIVTDEKVAADVYARLQKGVKFDELAKAHSVDPTKENGGAVGRFIPEEMFPAEVVAELPKIKEGVAYKPIKAAAPNGTVYFIVLIEKGNIRDRQLPPIDTPEVIGQIDQVLVRQLMGQIQSEMLRQLEVYDLKGNKIPLGPEQEPQADGIPLIGGGVKK